MAIEKYLTAKKIFEFAEQVSGWDLIPASMPNQTTLIGHAGETATIRVFHSDVGILNPDRVPYENKLLKTVRNYRVSAEVNGVTSESTYAEDIKDWAVVERSENGNPLAKKAFLTAWRSYMASQGLI